MTVIKIETEGDIESITINFTYANGTKATAEAVVNTPERPQAAPHVQTSASHPTYNPVSERQMKFDDDDAPSLEMVQTSAPRALNIPDVEPIDASESGIEGMSQEEL